MPEHATAPAHAPLERLTCIRCGYPLERGPREGDGACPECGTPRIDSLDRWTALGGEHAAAGRLVLASTFIATFSLLLFLLSVARLGNFRAFGGVDPWERAAGELSSPAAFACAIGAWWIWFTSIRAPSFRACGRAPAWASLALFAWLAVTLCTSALDLLHLNVVAPVPENRTLRWIFLLSRQLTILPVPIAIAILVHAAPRALSSWRRRSRVSRVIAWLIIAASVAVITLHATLLAMIAQLQDARILTRGVFDWLLDAAGILWSGAIPFLLLALAIAQLSSVRRAWRDGDLAIDRDDARHAMARRALVGAFVLPTAVGLTFLLSWMTKTSLDELPIAITSALRDPDALTTRFDWILVWLVALGALWFACAILPLAVMRRRAPHVHAA